MEKGGKRNAKFKVRACQVYIILKDEIIYSDSMRVYNLVWKLKNMLDFLIRKLC